MNRRVVVTGVGVISPIGNDYPTFKNHLKKGYSGCGPLTHFDTSHFPVKQAYEVKDFEPRKLGTHLLDPFIQYAVAATDQAITDASFEMSQVDSFRVGISVSSSKGGVHTIDRFKERFRKNPSAILGARIYSNSVPNFAAQWIARRWKTRGPAKCYISACATGTTAIIQGTNMVRDGVIDYCIAGASDASLVPLMLAGYRKMKALSKKNMKPFDQDRDGFLVGEGAGILFLETLESAQARGASIYGEIQGGAFGTDATHALHFSSKESALSRTLERFSKEQDIKPKDIDYINLHGTATPAGDLYETEQIKKAFGQEAQGLSTSSTKSMTGHMLGASGAVEAIAILAAMQEGFVPPTVGIETQDPACDLDYTPNQSRKKQVRQALSISMGFGGHISILGMRSS